MNPHFVLFILVTACCSCNQAAHNVNNAQPQNDSTGRKQKRPEIGISPEGSSKSFTFKDDDFVKRVLEHDISCMALNRLFNPKTSEKKLIIIPDENTRGTFDTAFTFTSGADSAAYLSSPSNCFATAVYIQTGRLVLDTIIKTGMPENVFINKFIPLRQLRFVPSKITITDTEDGNEFSFVFEKGQLSVINYKILYVD